MGITTRSTIWLSKNRGANVIEISITPIQIATAKRLAKENKVEHLVDFQLANYLTTGYPDNSFDVIWGLERICHAEDKSDFIREAFRVLKPGGRLVVADGWSRRARLNQQVTKDMRGWLDGWAVPHLSTVKNFSDNLKTI